MITEDIYTCVCIHNLMLVLVVNRPITGKGTKLHYQAPVVHEVFYLFAGFQTSFYRHGVPEHLSRM